MTRPLGDGPVGFQPHDHEDCIAGAIAAAETCDRLTPVRRRVLEILLAEHKALGAYDILERLAREGLGSQPPVAYRALDFLVGNGFAHRIERLSAFVACAHAGAEHAAAFLICRECRTVAEASLPQLEAGLGACAEAEGFAVERVVIEAEGFCARCLAAAG
jgi:Fur family zinc uptake transcriptional regulator